MMGLREWPTLEDNRRLQWLLLLGVMVAALLLRLYQLGTWSFWIDEVFSVQRSGRVFGDVFSWPPILPPLSLLGSRLFMLAAGVGEWQARLVPMLIGLLTLPLFFLQIRRYFPAGVALLAVLLIGVAPWHIYWSQNARFYTALLLLYGVAQMFFYQGLESRARWPLLVAALCLFFATGERLIALFLLPVLAAYPLLLWVRGLGAPQWLTWRRIGVAGGLVAALLLFDGYRYLTTEYSLLLTSIEIFVGKPTDGPFRLAVFIAYNMGFPLLVMGGIGALMVWLRGDRAGLYHVGGALVPVVLLLLLAPFVFTKDRYVFVTLLSWSLLAAVGIHAIWEALPPQRRFLALGVVGLLLADAAGDLLPYYTINNGNRRDWRGAFELVAQRAGPEDLVLTTWEELGDYYYGEQVELLDDYTPERVAASPVPVWVVVDSESVWATYAIYDWVRSNAELQAVLALRVNEDVKLEIYRYQPAGP